MVHKDAKSIFLQRIGSYCKTKLITKRKSPYAAACWPLETLNPFHVPKWCWDYFRMKIVRDRATIIREYLRTMLNISAHYHRILYRKNWRYWAYLRYDRIRHSCTTWIIHPNYEIMDVIRDSVSEKLSCQVLPTTQLLPYHVHPFPLVKLEEILYDVWEVIHEICLIWFLGQE